MEGAGEATEDLKAHSGMPAQLQACLQKGPQPASGAVALFPGYRLNFCPGELQRLVDVAWPGSGLRSEGPSGEPPHSQEARGTPKRAVLRNPSTWARVPQTRPASWDALPRQNPPMQARPSSAAGSQGPLVQ